MYTFVFDRQGSHGFLPNLVDKDIVPKSQEWWDLCLTPPYSYEFRFLRYLETDKVPFQEVLVDDVTDSHGRVIYPINIAYYDPELDYLSLASERALELCRQGQLLVLFYYCEGDDPTLDITPGLDKMREQYNLPEAGIKFVTGNALFDKGQYCYFPDHEMLYRHLHIREKNYVRQVNTSQRSKKFTCLNRIDKGFRKLFSAALWYHGLHEDGYFSYNGIRYQKEFQEADQDPVRWWKRHWQDTGMLLDNFDLHLPFKADDLSDADHNNHKLIDQRFYTDAYWNFVTETHFSKRNVFLTEKTFKPILNMQPFLMVGPPGSLKLLRDLGYQTFGEWIDESYDKIKSDEERLHVCFEVAYEIASMPHQQHIEMMKEMIPVLAHNQNVLMSSKRERLERLLNRILE